MEDKEASKDEKKNYSPMALPNPFTLESFSQEKIAYMSLYDTERWYPDVKDFTFETEFMELTPEEGRALVHHYQEHVLGRKGLLSNEEKDLLANLDKRLQEVMDSFCEKDPSSEFFVRLSSRSPKDVGLGPEHPKVLQWLEEEVNKFGGIETASPNDVLRSVQTAAGKILRVKTAAEALWLIENSERTFGDLIHTLDHLAEWEMKLVVRKWRDGVDVGTEFRAFMVEGELTAISQYNDSCFYHELVGKEELIVNKILEFWEEMKPHVKYQAAIVDFVLVDDFTKVYCVELNPFGPMTGAALFDWRYERRLLQRGKDLWKDLSECQERVMAGEDILGYSEFFANSSEKKPVLRILHSAPESATENLMDSIPVVRALKRKKKKEKEEKEKQQKEKEKKDKGSCALQ